MAGQKVEIGRLQEVERADSVRRLPRDLDSDQAAIGMAGEVEAIGPGLVSRRENVCGVAGNGVWTRLAWARAVPAPINDDKPVMRRQRLHLEGPRAGSVVEVAVDEEQAANRSLLRDNKWVPACAAFSDSCGNRMIE